MAEVMPMTGTVALVDFGSTVGSEQSGVRLAVIVSSTDYSDVMVRLGIVVPCTSRNRKWVNHIQLTGPTGAREDTFAMTEQPRTISSERVLRILGRVDETTLTEICTWTRTWIHQAM